MVDYEEKEVTEEVTPIGVAEKPPTSNNLPAWAVQLSDEVDRVNYEKAAAEIGGWLQSLKVSRAKALENAPAVEVLIQAVQTGHVVVNEDYTLTLKLKFPIELGKEGEPQLSISELTTRPRVKMTHVNTQLATLKEQNQIGIMSAYAAAVFAQSRSNLAELNSIDNSLVNQVIAFFL